MTRTEQLEEVARLQERHKVACNLKQTVDHDAITKSMLLWASEIGVPPSTRIEFISSAASAARDARDVWDASWSSIIVIGAVSLSDDKTAKIWSPILDAFEAGAFCFWVTDNIIYVSTIPTTVIRNERGRLHCEDGPAFVWMDDVRDYYWNGVNIPKEWIDDRKSITPKIALTWGNLEQRRVAIELIGWAKILDELSAKIIDEDGDPQIGTLVEVNLPDLRTPARFCRVKCGTGREFAVGVPRKIKTALQAQAWMQGRELHDFAKPEVRT